MSYQWWNIVKILSTNIRIFRHGFLISKHVWVCRHGILAPAYNPNMTYINFISPTELSIRLSLILYAKNNRTAHLIARSDISVAYVTNNKRLYSTFCTVETDYWQIRSTRGLFATAELLVLLNIHVSAPHVSVVVQHFNAVLPHDSFFSWRAAGVVSNPLFFTFFHDFFSKIPWLFIYLGYKKY